MSAGALLGVERLKYAYDDAAPVLRDVTLSLREGELMAVLGPSGCGKSTLLRCIAGLLAPCSGTIRLGGQALAELSPRQRRIVYLHQEALLFPHLDVFENLAFGLRLGRMPKAHVRARVSRLVCELGLEGLEGRKPETLSGGQRQRVAFGRALAIEPRVLLLDEPFNSLDTQTRSAMQSLFKRVSAQRRLSTLMVTHDLKEALVMGERFALMAGGRLRQFECLAAFAAEPESGVAQERSFWRAQPEPGWRPRLVDLHRSKELG